MSLSKNRLMRGRMSTPSRNPMPTELESRPTMSGVLACICCTIEGMKKYSPTKPI